MRVRLLTPRISIPNGARWPVFQEEGDVIDVTDADAVYLLENRMAEPVVVKQSDRRERRVTAPKEAT